MRVATLPACVRLAIHGENAMKSEYEIPTIEFESAITEAEKKEMLGAIGDQLVERNERDRLRREAALENLHFRKGWAK